MRTALLTAVFAAAAALLVPSLASAALFNGTSTNWSGYAATGQKFTSVSASWTQPVAVCGVGQTAASFWVGIDGDGSQTVEQIGAYSNCTSANVPQYYAWFEMYPNPAYKTSYPVQPGDAMSASVSADKVGRFTLSITDATQHWTASTTQRSSTAAYASAEVIAEAPSTSSGVVPLTDFGTVTFNGATANGATLGSFNPEAITMASGGVTKAVPGPLSNGSFTVTWQHA
jgi:hypothetical protein